MTEENGTVAQGVATQDQQVVSAETNQHLDAILGGVNGSSSSPALDELKSFQANAQQQNQAPAQAPVANPLVDSSFNQQGSPDVPQQQGMTFAEQQQAIENSREQQIPGQGVNNNDLVNLTGDEQGAGPVEGQPPVAEQNVAPVAAPVQPEHLVDSPLLQIKNEVNTAQAAPNPLANVQGIDQVNSYLSSQIPGVENLESLISGYSELSQSVTASSEVQANYDQLVNGLNNLHPDILEVMRMNEAGEDFRGYLSSRPDIDYTADERDVDVKSLVKAYFPEKISEADYDASNKDSENYDANTERFVKGVEERALEKFGRDKTEYSSRADEYIEKNQGRKLEYNTSIKESLSSVKGIFPGVQDSYLNSVEDKIMKNGIDSLFYDDKGNLKADAAAQFVMASDDGRDLLATLQTIAQKKAATEANLDTITRSQRIAPEQGGVGTMQDVNEGSVENHIKNFTGGLNTAHTY